MSSRKRFLGYSRESEIRVTRTKHFVGFREGQSAVNFIAALKHVPPDAKIINVHEGDSEEDIYPYIVFECETEGDPSR